MKSNLIKVFNDSTEIIEKRITNSETISNQESARLLNYEQHYLVRIFQRYSGMTIQEYIKKRKMSHALLDLIRTNNNISDIAEKFLYSADGFTKAFKDIFGITPEMVRKMKKDSSNSTDIFDRFTNRIIVPDYSKFIDEPKEYRIEDGEDMKFIVISDFDDEIDYDLLSGISEIDGTGKVFEINYFENGKIISPECFYANYYTPFSKYTSETKMVTIPARKWLILSAEGFEMSFTLSALSTYARYEWINKHDEYIIDDDYEIGFQNDDYRSFYTNGDLVKCELWVPIKGKW